MSHPNGDDDEKEVNDRVDAADAAVEEEDWSDFVVDGGGGAFARHDSLKEFVLPIWSGDGNGAHETMVTVQIASVSSLSPLDMIHLSWGTHDATGHRIWMGAKLFLHAIPLLAKDCFASFRILELGAGTGIAGIAVAKSVTSVQEVVITDASLSALDLCRKNCDGNQVGEHVHIKKLCWGDALEGVNHGDAGGDAILFNTVLAADVLYDLNMWRPILQTASQSMKDDGILILSHVPRAALSPEDVERGRTIEDVVLIQATSNGFELISTIQPQDVPFMDEWEQKDMQDIGAAIFVWRKTTA